MKANKNSHHSVSTSLNKNIISKNHTPSSNISTTQRTTELIKNKASTKNILEMIYDDEFVIMINQLSTSIKNYYRSNNKNFLAIKNILKNNDINNHSLLETFNKIENAFSYFYSSAKQIFKNMKIYRREKISNIMNQNKKKSNNRNNLNATIKQRNSDMRLKQLIKGENELSTNNILNNNKTLSINITQQNINNNINSSVNISNIMINSNSKTNNIIVNNSNKKEKGFSPIYDQNNINNNNISEFAIDNIEDNSNCNSNQKTNYEEYFDVIKNINKKNVIKSSKKVSDYIKEENNLYMHNKRGNSVNNNNSMIINSLNKNENKKNKNKKIINSSSSKNQSNGDKQGRMRITSIEKNLQNSLELKKYKTGEQISLNDIIINDSMNMNNDEFNNIIKEKDNIIINLKSNKIHLENKIKELENDNNNLNIKINNIEKDIKEKDKEIIDIKNKKEKLNIDNNNYKNKLEEILNEKKPSSPNNIIFGCSFSSIIFI